MKNKEINAIMQMIQYINKAFNYICDYDFNDFCKDEKTQDAVIFNISQVGEMIKNVSSDTMKKYSNIEWNVIKGLRNRIVHDYAGINLENIWFIIENDLKPLKQDLNTILTDFSTKKIE